MIQKVGAFRCCRRHSAIEENTNNTYSMKSTQTDNIQSSPKSKHLSLIEHQLIKRWLNERISVTEIANRSGRNKSSISRETKRGKAEQQQKKL